MSFRQSEPINPQARSTRPSDSRPSESRPSDSRPSETRPSPPSPSGGDPSPTVAYPDDPNYRRAHKLELEYVDPAAGVTTFFNVVQKPEHGDVSLLALHAAVGVADDVYIITWLMNPELELLRDGWDRPVADAARQNVRLAAVLLAAAKRGARITIIVWDFLNLPSVPFGSDVTLLDGLPPGDLELETQGLRIPIMNRVQKLRDQLRAISPKNEIVFLRHPTTRLGSLHQKFWIVRKGTRLLGFVGGINLSQWDWDEHAHDVLNPRRNPPEMEGSARKARFDLGIPPQFDPRHDWMMRVDGHGAHALLEEFYARWALSNVPVPPRALPNPADVEAKGTMFVQVSRQWPLDPSPGQILTAYTHAIGRAEKYIYIENQYWTSSTLTDAILSRLSDPEVTGLEVVIVLPSKAEDTGAQLILAEQLYQLRRLDAALQSQLYVYQLFRKIPGRAAYLGVYVHAKLAIVDDRWMTVGSANTNNRSMALDSECNAQIAHADFVTATRKLLWAELVGDPAASGDDPRLAITQGFYRVGVKNARAKASGNELTGLIVPVRVLDVNVPWPRPPDKLRKYL